MNAQLANVSALLAGVPAPPIPGRVARSLIATLAAESASRLVASTATVRPAPREPVRVAGRADPRRLLRPARHSMPGRRRSWLHGWSTPLALRAMAATGVIVLITVGGLWLGYAGGHRSPASSGSQEAPSRRAQSPAMNSNTPVAGLPVRYRHAGAYATTTAVASTADYTRSDLASGVSKEIASVPALYPASAPTAGISHPGGAVQRPAGELTGKIGRMKVSQLAGCLASVAGNREVLLAEVAHYLGEPVTIVVFRPIGNIYPVIVAGLACTAAHADVVVRLSVPKS